MPDCRYADRSRFVLYFKIGGDGKDLNRFVLNTRLVRHMSEINCVCCDHQEPGSIVGMLPVLRAGYPRSFGSISGRGKRYVSFSEAPRLAVGSTHPLIE